MLVRIGAVARRSAFPAAFLAALSMTVGGAWAFDDAQYSVFIRARRDRPARR
jgi:hypothetical protein